MSAKTCIVCGKEKRPNQLLKHKNDLLNDQMTICRECANAADLTNEEEMIAYCQLANIPYVKSLVIEVVKDNKNPNFGQYMKKLAPYKIGRASCRERV